jgi:hypothetical protein
MASDTAPAALTCAVCGEDVSPAMSAECNWCGRRFHLNQRNDVESKDCGKVWIDEQYMALRFACDDCLAGGRDEAPAAAARPRRLRVRRRRYRRRS